MTRTPAEFASWVRKVHAIASEPRPIDLIALVSQCGGIVEELDLRGCSGALLLVNGSFAIAVRASDPYVRKRFTIAHELGHFCIPTHKKSAALCVAPELSKDGSVRISEREASDFAAELLMPRKLVQPLLEKGAIDLERAEQIEGTFAVSKVAAALRACEVTRERAAVVYSQDGVIRWAYRFGFPYGLPPNGSRVSGDTVIGDVFAGRAGSKKAQAVDAGAWLPLGRPDSSWGELLESTVAQDDNRSALTMLWLTSAS
jgi:uncharacterized protein DUF955